MKKYFKEEETKKLRLSEYLKLDKSQFKCFLCEEKYIGPRTKYIIDAIGDVELDEDVYKLFLSQFQCSGGRYDVRMKKETIKGIYDISQKYPFLTADALDEIWFIYIHDQFEEYSLDKILEKYIELYGKTEKALFEYIHYVDETAKEFDKQFCEEADKLDMYYSDYDKDLIKRLQYVIKSQHISLEKIISSLPSRELIDKDKEHLVDISTKTRIYFGVCEPISYQMIESLATGKGLDDYPEHPAYYISTYGTEIPALFTKTEFLESIEKAKIKRLERK